MSSRLLDQIKKEDRPISIIVDASDDSNKNHYLSVLFQILKTERPTVYFYKLIKVGKSETAEAYYDLIMDEFEIDDLKDCMKKNLVGFSSDGANVMRGDKGGLYSFFKVLVNPNYIHPVYCAAHRIDILLKNSMKCELF